MTDQTFVNWRNIIYKNHKQHTKNNKTGINKSQRVASLPVAYCLDNHTLSRESPKVKNAEDFKENYILSKQLYNVNTV